MHPRLLELPDELLFAICEHLDMHSLFLLAQISRRLHQFCIPICLGKFDIGIADKHIKIVMGEDQHVLDAVSALNLAFDLRSIERISCKFAIPGNDISLMLRCVDRLERFIRRLSVLKIISLSFVNEKCFCCGTPQFNEGWLEEWSLAMGGLMSAILEKSADTVTLKGGRYLSHLFVFKYNRRPVSSKTVTPLDTIKLMFKGRKERKSPTNSRTEPLSVLKGDSWEFKKAKNTHVGLTLSELLPSAQVNTKLRSLSIQSMMFLMPPLLQWTISAMQYSNLQKLTLNNLSINHKCWPAIFELIASASPNLAELVLAKLRQIMPNDLLQFLSRLTGLTSLSLGRDVDTWDSYELGPFPDLPKLINLYAPSIWILKLLTAQPRGLQCLETLCISYKLRNDGLTHWLQPSATPSIPGLLQAHDRPLTLAVEVLLGNTPGWKMFADLNSLVTNPDRRLISSITLVVNQDFGREDMNLWTVLPKWLAMFPALRQLSLKGTNPTIDSLDAMDTLREVVKASGLQLESLNVNGKEGLTSTSA